MAFVIADRIKETSTTTGTGTFTLDGAITGFRSFASVGNANTTTYLIVAVDANGVPTGEWETGIGTYTSSGTTLSRGVIASSTGSAVSFSAGTKHVICADVAGYATPLVMATTANRAIQVAEQTALGATAGNARGVAAVDLQIARNSNTRVASGDHSFACGRNNTASGGKSVCLGGSNNTASGYYAVTGGSANAAAGYYAIAFGGSSHSASASYATCVGGRYNVASAAKAVVVGGFFSTASGAFGTIAGGYKNTASGEYTFIGSGLWAKADKYGQHAHANGKFASGGDAQASVFVLRRQTTNNTPVEAFLDGSSAILALANDTTWAFDGLVIARRTDADGTNSGWSFSGVIKRDTNAASTALVGTCTPAVIMQDASAAATSVTITADTTNGSLLFTVTGETSKTYNWVIYLRTVEVTG